ncbi:flagellar hook capping FlgD N-terminal domain-containing protein [Aliiroseovarius sp. YM-037]|uniref:flagellar hook capping FlgD N-terminal domain-containing protein n=1 Tax=Aliiroseovarius sp. YM-037 TaxID=3341728 RepID=UPI003A80C31C
MDVTQATATAPKPVDSPKTQSAAAINSDFETFLKMLTAQIQNQDPLNPMQSQDFAVQLATFSGVEQQVRTNDLLQGMGAQMGLSGLSQMASWVGMEARAAAPTQFDGTPIELTPKPAANADAAQLVVRNAAGDEVQRFDIPVTDDPINWAGVGDDGTPVPSGAYSFEVESYSGTEALGTTPIETYARITEARSENGQTVFVLDSGAKVEADDITALREPDGSG